jgi:hypothetical protein
VIRLRGTVEYDGGRTVEFETGTAALAEWELYALRHGYPIGEKAPPMLSALVIAHHALGVEEGFDVWRKTVAGVDLDASAVDPTQAVPSTVYGQS